METRFPFFAVIAGVGVTALVVILGWLDRKKLPPQGEHSPRDGKRTAGASAVHRAVGRVRFPGPECGEQREENDDQGLGGEDEATFALTWPMLGPRRRSIPKRSGDTSRRPRTGLDWRAIFDEAVADELRERPFAHGLLAGDTAVRAPLSPVSHSMCPCRFSS